MDIQTILSILGLLGVGGIIGLYWTGKFRHEISI